MSYFIANSIQFNSDKTEVKVKGGDNNIVPRENYWSGYFTVEQLFNEYNSNSIQFLGYDEKLALVEFCLDESYDEVQFKDRLKKEFVNYVPSAKSYVVARPNGSGNVVKYVVKNFKVGYGISYDVLKAKKFSRYSAIKVAKKVSGFKPIHLTNKLNLRS